MLGFVHNYVKLCGIVSPGGSTLSFRESKFTDMRVNWGDDRPNTVATHHHRLGMIWYCYKEKFRGFSIMRDDSLAI